MRTWRNVMPSNMSGRRSMTPAKEFTAKVGTQEVTVRKDYYTGLWNVWYVSGHSPKWAGPFRTKREAVSCVVEATND